jgi:PTH1 family peptidyl-tRNA hydrolase
VFLIVGLGNIGRKYKNTRHNIGFEVVDYIAEKLLTKWNPGKGDYFYASFKFKDQEVLLLKPSTYMNESGVVVSDALQTFSISLSDLLIICDDFNLPLGKIRLRPQGSDGGHNGLASIIYHLVTENFPRLRIGIGANFGNKKMEKYVLSKFEKSEREIINSSIFNASNAVFNFIDEGIHKTMNKFN